MTRFDFGARLEARLREATRARLEAFRQRTDEGQALIVLAIILVLLVSLMPISTLFSLNAGEPLTAEATNFESALAAAQTGLQEYINLLDQYPDYWKDFTPQSGGANNTNDPGINNDGGSNLALGGWQPISGSSPAEAFTYYPDLSEVNTVQSASNPFGGDIMLVVTGMAGSGKGVQYRRIEAALTVSGIITDVYFSNYEQPGAEDLGQWQNTYNSGCTVGANGCGNPLSSGANEYDEAVAPACYKVAGVSTCYSESGTTPVMATALCQVDYSQVNNFITWYSQNVQKIYPLPGYPNASTAYGYTLPGSTELNLYYGPWYGSFPDPLSASYQFGVASVSGFGSPPSSSTLNDGNQSACLTNYWITGDTFDGPVYSQDELTTCGAPAFQGNPSISTDISANEVLPAGPNASGTIVGWPGATAPASVATSVYPTGHASYPVGYNANPWKDCGLAGNPSLATPVDFGVAQQLPSTDNELLGEIEDGAEPGCIYTGPTMIRFTYTAAGGEVMDVWSPLTKDTYGAGSPTPENSVNCGATATTGADDLCGGTACIALPSNEQVQGASPGTVEEGDFAQVSVPSTGLAVYVQSLPSGTDPNAWSSVPNAAAGENLSGFSNCIDPWTDPGTSSVSATTCTEGDAILSGDVGAPITVAAANDVVVSRSLVYACATNANGSYQTTLANCTNSTNALGLVAQNNIWISRPWTSSGGNAAACSDDNDTLAAGTVTWANMVPNCTPTSSQSNLSTPGPGPILDAALAAEKGFVEVANWRYASTGGGVGTPTLYLNGSDAVNNNGQFGVFGGGGLQDGDLLTLTYDSRLKTSLAQPPDYLSATDSIYIVTGWVTCGNTTPNPNSSTYPASGVPSCAPSPSGTYPP
jgi:hypothetical protein